MKKFILCLFTLFLLITSACGYQPISTQHEVFVTGTSADDPCSSENLPTTVQGLNDLMREFDDAAQLVSNTPAQQLPTIISKLQRIRRNAEDTQIPACLGQLKTHQLNHMNLMIQTLIAFVGGASKKSSTLAWKTRAKSMIFTLLKLCACSESLSRRSPQRHLPPAHPKCFIKGVINRNSSSAMISTS